MITKDNDKSDDKKLKGQSKNNLRVQDRIKKNSRLKKKVKSQESWFKVQDLKNQDQYSRIKRRLNQDKYKKFFSKIE